jgi:hypothetical protein
VRKRHTEEQIIDFLKEADSSVPRHRRYGTEQSIYKLRQEDPYLNHKRTERLYVLEKLQLRRRPSKKIPPQDRQPLIRPGAANAVCEPGPPHHTGF